MYGTAATGGTHCNDDVTPDPVLSSSGIGKANDRTRLTTPTTSPPQNAGQNPATVKPRSQRADSHPVTSSMIALITSVNRPSVRTMSGQVSTVSSGRSRLFTTPNTAATSSEVEQVAVEVETRQQIRRDPQRDGIQQPVQEEGAHRRRG